MIVMTRQVNEAIRVNVPGHGDVLVTVRRISSDRIELELQGPRTLPVCRGEFVDISHRSDGIE
jgi:sRNA-binding carbon storage regulator CsrA